VHNDEFMIYSAEQVFVVLTDWMSFIMWLPICCFYLSDLSWFCISNLA